MPPPSQPKKAHSLFPLLAVLALFAVGSAIHAAQLSIWSTLGIAAFTAVLFLANCSGAGYIESFRLFMLASMTGSIAWLIWSWFDQAWRPSIAPWTIGALLAGGLAATGPWQRIRYSQHDWKHRAHLYAGPDEPTPEDAEKVSWEATFKAAGADGLEFVRREEHPAGFSLITTSTRVTLRQLQGRLENLETVTRVGGKAIPAGCITADPVLNADGRPLAGEFILTFDIVDVLKHTAWMPDDHTPLSILHAFPVGVHADGTVIHLTIKEIQTMIAGLTGSGKSMFLHVLIHQISRCRDAVIWMGDFKGGATAKPWLMAFLRGLARVPVLDWVATDQFELERMLRAAVRIIERRPAWRTGSRWKVSPKKPAIIIILDELADAVGMGRAPRSVHEGRGLTGHQMAALLATIVSKGRSEGVWVIAAGQRNSVSMFGSGDLMSQMGQRLAFAGIEPQMIGALFASEPGAARIARNLLHEGSFVLWRALQKGLSVAKKCRSYFLGDDDDLDSRTLEASILHQDYAPPVDENSEACANEYGYADRWTDERCQWLSNAPHPDSPDRSTQLRPAPAATATATLERDVTTTDNGMGFWQGPAPATTRPTADTAPAGNAADPRNDPLTPASRPVFQPGQPAPPPRRNGYDYAPEKQLLLTVVGEHPAGISFTQIVRVMRERGAKAGTPALNAWMQDYLDNQKLAQPGGPRTLWFLPKYATGGISRGVGESEVPPAAG
jgi:hypothetical protein